VLSEHGAVERTHAEHRAILSELSRRDPELARIRMEVHLFGVERFAMYHPTDAGDPGEPARDQ
jgi:GntR family transcriptional repressor for pyruvate dehydrogenase complex